MFNKRTATARRREKQDDFESTHSGERKSWVLELLAREVSFFSLSLELLI